MNAISDGDVPTLSRVQLCNLYHTPLFVSSCQQRTLLLARGRVHFHAAINTSSWRTMATGDVSAIPRLPRQSSQVFHKLQPLLTSAYRCAPARDDQPTLPLAAVLWAAKRGLKFSDAVGALMSCWCITSHPSFVRGTLECHHMCNECFEGLFTLNCCQNTPCQAPMLFQVIENTCKM
jgi:hypothetical protein